MVICFLWKANFQRPCEFEGDISNAFCALCISACVNQCREKSWTFDLLCFQTMMLFAYLQQQPTERGAMLEKICQRMSNSYFAIKVAATCLAQNSIQGDKLRTSGSENETKGLVFLTALDNADVDDDD